MIIFMNRSSVSCILVHARIQSRDIEISRKHVKARFSRPCFYQPYHKMANISTQRTPLGELSSNIIRGKELTPKVRGKVLGMKEAGHNVPYIMRRLKLSRCAVRYTIDQDELRDDAETLPRPG
jgi:hypothetical protein